jgi:putative FmdB family regulatory protein
VPLYEYACPVCGNQCELFRLMNNRDAVPVCMRDLTWMVRVPSAPPTIWNTTGRGGQ